MGTTALSEFWDSSLPIVFLGSWCLRYDQRPRWEGLSYDILEYPWDNHERLLKAKRYCDEVYEVLLPRLAEFLNTTHDVDHGLQYWRIIVGEWLWRYIQVLYDRYCCLKNAFKVTQGFKTILLDESSYQYPRDNVEFMWVFCNSDIYNLQLYSQILRAMGFDYPSRPWRDGENHAMTIKEYLKEAVRDGAAILRSRMRGGMPNETVAICLTAQSLLGVERFGDNDTLRLRKLFFKKRMPLLKPDEVLRGKFLSMKGADEFQEIFFNTLKYNFPLVFLEGYNRLKDEVAACNTPMPRVIITAVDWRFDTRAAFYIAQAVENGAKIIGLQHGGGYGIFEIDSMFDQELKVVDKFISWGWTQLDNPQIVPLPQPILSREKMPGNATRMGTLLFVASTHSRYHNIFQSSPLGPQYKAYIQDQIAFFLSLPEDVKNAFWVRLYPAELGWYNRDRLEEAVPGLRYSDGRKKFLEDAKDSRLVVCDNNQTAYLQSLGLNIPTIIFWDENVWKIREAARPFFQELKNVGVFHGTPHSAARFIDNNRDQIEEWWSSSDVQSAVDKFRMNYCRTSDNWKQEWYQAICQEAINTN